MHNQSNSFCNCFIVIVTEIKNFPPIISQRKNSQIYLLNGYLERF